MSKDCNIIEFTKMEGLGNDYIYINCLDGMPENPEQLSVEMSDRHFGVGGDGIILIMPSEIADYRMRIFNADGSEAQMCGNGIRCVGKYLYDNSLVDGTVMSIETNSGVKNLEILEGNTGFNIVSVDMGEPSLIARNIPVETNQQTFINQEVEIARGLSVNATAVSMGNPHAVVFVDDVDEVDVVELGSFIEHNYIFPEGVNVEFAQVISENEIRMRVWERGSGVTLACGTGACATLVAAVVNDLAARRSVVNLDGGWLSVSWDEKTNHVTLVGEANMVFNGTYRRKNVQTQREFR